MRGVGEDGGGEEAAGETERDSVALVEDSESL